MTSICKNQKGSVPLVLLIAGIGLIGFLGLFTMGPAKDKLFTSLYPKPDSHAATANGSVGLSLAPSTITTTPNSIITLGVTMSPQSVSVSGATTDLKFDPSKLQATDIKIGTGLSQPLDPCTFKLGVCSVPFTDAIKYTDSSKTTQTGQIYFSVGAKTGDPFVNTQTVIATITFKTLAAGSSQISFNSANTQVAASGMTGDQAGNLLPATVTVNAPASPSPSPLPSPSPSPTPKPSPTPTALPSPTPAGKTVIEAESLSTDDNWIRVFSDSQASGGKGMYFYSAGDGRKSFTLLGNTTQLVVRAKADQCKGAPILQILVDSKSATKKTQTVNVANWTDYTFSLNLAAGKHTLTVSFTNDLYIPAQRCDRNLIVDKVTLF